MSWGDRYDRALSDIFAVQDEITASVAGVIDPALAEAERQRVLRKPLERLDAWEAYWAVCLLPGRPCYTFFSN
jgi:adenylate cyclase